MPEKFIKSKDEIKRIKTYIEGYDEQLQGGIPEGHIVLVSGAAGTMKSSVVFNMMYHEVLSGKKALYVTLEQSAPSLIKHIINMNYDINAINIIEIDDISNLKVKLTEAAASKKGSLLITDISAIRKQIKNVKLGPNQDWMNIIQNIISKMKEQSGCDIFSLDSLSSLHALSHFEQPRSTMFYFFEFLRDKELTSFIISEMPLDKSRYSDYEVEDYLADGIIFLELAERQRKVTREISIVKMRTTACNTDIFTLEYDGKKFKALYGGQPPLL